MSTNVHINRHIVQAVEVEEHPQVPGLITLTITESASGSHGHETLLTMHLDYWQQVVDQLAALGVDAGVTA